LINLLSLDIHFFPVTHGDNQTVTGPHLTLHTFSGFVTYATVPCGFSNNKTNLVEEMNRLQW